MIPVPQTNSVIRNAVLRAAVLAALLAVLGCERQSFDWEQPEDLFLSRETKTLEDGSVEMRFVSLVNAPADGIFRALSDVERHDKFIEGVTESKLVSSDGNKKVVDITNRVLGRPNRVKIEWTINKPNREISFRTLASELTDNSAEYKVESSPNGKRSLVTTVYHLRDKGGHPFPLHALKMAIEDGYAAAVRGVKRQALGSAAVVG